MVGRESAWTPGKSRKLVGARGHHEQEQSAQEVGAAGGFGG